MYDWAWFLNPKITSNSGFMATFIRKVKVACSDKLLWAIFRTCWPYVSSCKVSCWKLWMQFCSEKNDRCLSLEDINFILLCSNTVYRQWEWYTSPIFSTNIIQGEPSAAFSHDFFLTLWIPAYPQPCLLQELFHLFNSLIHY